jgi:hypothetical protein
MPGRPFHDEAEGARRDAALRPEWARESDDAAAIKVVMTGSADGGRSRGRTFGASPGARRKPAISRGRQNGRHKKDQSEMRGNHSTVAAWHVLAYAHAQP